MATTSVTRCSLIASPPPSPAHLVYLCLTGTQALYLAYMHLTPLSLPLLVYPIHAKLFLQIPLIHFDSPFPDIYFHMKLEGHKTVFAKALDRRQKLACINFSNINFLVLPGFLYEKYHIRETTTLSVKADSRTNTLLEKLPNKMHQNTTQVCIKFVKRCKKKLKLKEKTEAAGDTDTLDHLRIIALCQKLTKTIWSIHESYPKNLFVFKAPSGENPRVESGTPPCF